MSSKTNLHLEAQRLTRPGTGAVGTSVLGSPVHVCGRAARGSVEPAALCLMVVTSARHSWKRRRPHLSSRWWPEPCARCARAAAALRARWSRLLMHARRRRRPTGSWWSRGRGDGRLAPDARGTVAPKHASSEGPTGGCCCSLRSAAAGLMAAGEISYVVLGLGILGIFIMAANLIQSPPSKCLTRFNLVGNTLNRRELK